MGEGLNKPLFSQRCLQTFFIFLSRAPCSLARFAFAIARSPIIEKKHKGRSEYRLAFSG